LGLFSILILIQLINLQEPDQAQGTEGEERHLNHTISMVDRRYLILSIAVFFFAFLGVEIGFGDWLATYSVQTGLAGKKTAVLLTSAYWGSFTAGRLLSIPLSLKIEPKNVLAMDVSGSAIALGLILCFPGSSIMLWIGSVLLGFSLASIFATMLTFTRSFMEMSGRITSIFFVGGSIGSIVLPWIIGRYIERTGPFLIMQVLSISMFLAVLSFLVVNNLSKRSYYR
jgi:FHS family Na+ dependent glucose MFS transporter 1